MTSLCDEATPGSRKAISDEAIIGLASRNSVPFQRTDFWLGPEWFSQEYVQWWNEWYAPPAEQWFFYIEDREERRWRQVVKHNKMPFDVFVFQ